MKVKYAKWHSSNSNGKKLKQIDIDDGTTAKYILWKMAKDKGIYASLHS